MWGSADQKRAFGQLWPLWHGDPGQRDRRAAVRGLTRLAEAGYAPAQFVVGMAHFDGEGIRRDVPTAFDWLLRSAEQGYPGAQAMVGNFLIMGSPAHSACPYDPEKAAHWHERAARSGHSSAQYNLAFSYWTGRGVARNPLDTYVWASLSVACATLRNRPSEALRGQAAALLGADARTVAEQRVTTLGAGLPHAWSEPLQYWRHLAGAATR